MYSVSLLPSEYRSIHQTSQKKNVGLLISIAVMGALAVAYIILQITSANAALQLEQTELDNTAMMQQISKLQNMEDINNEANSLFSQAAAVYGTTPEWDRLMSSIGNSVPLTAGLTNLNMKYSAGTGECTVQGTAPDQLTVSQWINDLSAIEGVSNVKCNFSNKSSDGTGVYMQFEISFKLLPSAGYMLPQGDEGNE